MPLKNRLGSFFILAGLIALLIFVASVAAGQAYDLPALLAAVVLVPLGVHWALAKRPAPPPRPAGPPPAAPAAAPAAPNGAKKKRGLFRLTGKKTAPAAAPAPAAPAGKGNKGGKGKRR
jgi:hypothetical protein